MSHGLNEAVLSAMVLQGTQSSLRIPVESISAQLNYYDDREVLSNSGFGSICWPKFTIVFLESYSKLYVDSAAIT